MSELRVHSIDEVLHERMLMVAKSRGWSLNEVALRALRYALDISSEHPLGRDRHDIATMRGIWNQIESQAFSEAMEAFKRVESGPTFESVENKSTSK